jgi:hypothetical protein
VAFYPATIALPIGGVFNGVLVSDWVFDGAAMFDITRKHFDIFNWVRHGRISNGGFYKLLNLLLFDPSAPRRIVSKAPH